MPPLDATNLPLPLHLAAGDPLSHVISNELFTVFGLPVTNHMMMTVVAGVVVLLSTLRLSKKMPAPGETDKSKYVITGRFSQFIETICVFIRDQVARPNLGHLTDKYVPYLWTVFFFILFANVLGLVPSGPIIAIVVHFLGGDAYEASYWGGTATGTIALTVPLALTAFVAINLIGVKEAGVGYFKHFNPGPAYMAPLLVPLEVMGLIIKCSVLAMRLFGTMMAGHLVIAVFLGLIALAAAVGAAIGGVVGLGVTVMGFALMALELFIALLQAFIFTFLTTLFIAQGAVHHEPGHDEAHGESIHEPEIAERAVMPG
ncbi:MAG: F0F1 ATP synthase subunit A [Phycisphaeraceae bacterium]